MVVFRQNRGLGRALAAVAVPGFMVAALLAAGVAMGESNAAPHNALASTGSHLPLRPLVDPQTAAPVPLTAWTASAEVALLAELDRLSQSVVDGGHAPGMAWVLVSQGRLVDARGYGVTDINRRGQVGPQTVFRLASLSKAFASALTGLLVDQGVIEWSDRVQDLVPALLLKDDAGAGHLRIDELLSHRVGLPHNTYDRQIESEQPYPLLVEKLNQISPLCHVGDCYAYQNVAFSLIGDVVFAATGDFFSHQVEKRLFHPLGMTTATYGRDALFASPSYASPHVRSRGRWLAVTPKETYYRLPPAAGVNASALDMGQWLLAQLGHRPDVLPENLVSILHEPQVLTPGEVGGSGWRRERLHAAAYALGWRVFDYAGHDLIFHAGAVQGYRAVLGLLPAEDFGFAVLWNAESGVPSGVFPTALDRRLALPEHDWLQPTRIAKPRKTTPGKRLRVSSGSSR